MNDSYVFEFGLRDETMLTMCRVRFCCCRLDEVVAFEWPVLARYDKPHYVFDYVCVRSFVRSFFWRMFRADTFFGRFGLRRIIILSFIGTAIAKHRLIAWHRQQPATNNNLNHTFVLRCGVNWTWNASKPGNQFPERTTTECASMRTLNLNMRNAHLVTTASAQRLN